MFQNFITFDEDSLVSEQENICREIQEIEEKLELMPEGNLTISCSNSHKYVSYYIRENDRRFYVSNKDKDLLSVYALKRYYKSRLLDLKQILFAKKRFDKNSFGVGRAEKFLCSSALIRELVLRKIGDYSEEEIEWGKLPSDGLNFHPEGLKIRVSNHLRFRSKSEEMIFKELVEAGLVFRYECDVAGYISDFVIIHPRTHEKIIWEHFGIMDDANYFGNCLKKLNEYYRQGYVMGVNLIITAETINEPINVMHVKHLINDYFLI